MNFLPETKNNLDHFSSMLRVDYYEPLEPFSIIWNNSHFLLDSCVKKQVNINRYEINIDDCIKDKNLLSKSKDFRVRFSYGLKGIHAYHYIDAELNKVILSKADYVLSNNDQKGYFTSVFGEKYH